jgi:hypothetical protein
MTSVPFDTLKLADRLQAGGFLPEQAKAASAAMAEALADGVTSDISTLKSDVASLKADFALFKWMLGFALAFLVAITIKMFVH